jgi:nitrogen fixation NifU-like protein
MFTEKLLEHFEHPKNAGELPGASALVEVSNPVCGDILQLAVIVETGVVREARFLCRGCAASIACASVLTVKMIGHTLQEISAREIAEELGGLPEASFHAAQLAAEAAHAMLQKILDLD